MKKIRRAGARPLPIVTVLALFTYLIAVLVCAVLFAYDSWPKILAVTADTVAKDQFELRLVRFVFCLGVLGACLHAMTSLATFVGNRRFQGSWMLWYLLRPFVGGALAWVVYLTFRGGLLRTDASDAINPHAFGALAAFAGMFSKSVVDKLSEIVDVLFRMPKGKGDDARGDKAGAQSMSIEAIRPDSLSLKNETTTLTIDGAGFGDTCVVEIGGSTLAPSSATETQLMVDVPVEVFVGRSSVDVRVRGSTDDGAVTNAVSLAVTH